MTPLDTICAALRGEATAPPAQDAGELLALMRVHGVGPLVHHQAELGGWPDEVTGALATMARDEIANELLRQKALADVLEALDAAGVRPLILKGAALAYGLYEEPSTRVRGDSDLLIREGDRTAARRVLTDLGYEACPSAAGELGTYQQLYDSGQHSVDLHHRISNAQLFALALTYIELDAVAVALPGLGPQARGLAPHHALLHALMHRATHVNAPYYVEGVKLFEPNRLIWLYDIHLLVRALGEAEGGAELAELAEERQVRAVCLDGLRAAAEAFDTPLPPGLMARLSTPGPAEPSAAYLRRGNLRRAWVELVALPSWTQRAQLIAELALPPADYMLDRYQTDRRALLPWLYVRRVGGGLVRLLTSPAESPE